VRAGSDQRFAADRRRLRRWTDAQADEAHGRQAGSPADHWGRSRAGIGRATIKRLSIEELEVTRLKVTELEVAGERRPAV
jgi:hypothetical protein